MGLGDSYVSNGEGDGDRVSEAAPTCSICFDTVTTGGGRSTAKLECGHEFHLDCIGSAFNAKGMMQCPNCRNIEKGNWLNGNGFCLLPAISIDESYDGDIYDLNHLEMPYGVQWCPVNRIESVTSSYVNGESFPPVAYQDLVNHQVVFTELPSSSVFASTFQASSDSPANTIYYNLWCQVADPTQVPSPLSLPTGDVHYHGWDPYPSSAYSYHRDTTSASIQASASHVATHNTRLDDGCPPMAGSLFYSFIDRPHSLPLLPDHSSNRARNIPGEHSTSHSDLRRSGNIRNHLPFAGPTTTWPSSPVHSGFYIYPPPLTIFYSGRVGDTVITGGDRFQTSQVVQFMPTGPAESGSQSGFWLRHPSGMLSAPANGSVRVRPFL